jgi:opacity protein-like surface antigen
MTIPAHVSARAVGALIPLLVMLLADSASAVVRRTDRPLLYGRTAVSGFVGYGLPVGEFASDDYEGDGNHAEGAPDWTIEIEHFVGRTTSIGFSAANTTYEDKTFGDSLKTHVSTYSGFVRVVVPTATAIRPYLRFGMGGVQVQFQNPDERVDSDWEFSLQAGAGLLWMPTRWIGLNAQALYYYGDTEDAYIAESQPEPTIVGFDTKYFAFSGGLSLFFP